ncbi:MAG: hypothetical protein ACKPKO_04075, partial [Candidatus Fonsibacter sp.]
KATHLKKVYFYDYDERAEKEKDMIQYFDRQVENYKLQDKKANRSIDDANFITKEWFMICVGTSWRLVRRLPHLQQIAREDRLQPDGTECLQQRGAPPGQRHTLLRLLQCGDVEQIEESH